MLDKFSDVGITLRYYLQLGIPPENCCHFANSSGLGPISLCHHNISKNITNL